MTGQVNDTCVYLERVYAVAGSDAELFAPAAHGLAPVMLHTGCWRGYIAAYAVVDGRLTLSGLAVRTREGVYPPIGGVEAEPDQYGTAQYRGLALPVAYTGQLLLAADFIQERYIHMGFQSPSSYQTVLALSFDAGALTAVEDLSAAMAQTRAWEDEQQAQGGPGPLKPPPPA